MTNLAHARYHAELEAIQGAPPGAVHGLGERRTQGAGPVKPWLWYLAGVLTPCVLDALLLVGLWASSWRRVRRRPIAPEVCSRAEFEPSDREVVDNLLRSL